MAGIGTSSGGGFLASLSKLFGGSGGKKLPSLGDKLGEQMKQKDPAAIRSEANAPGANAAAAKPFTLPQAPIAEKPAFTNAGTDLLGKPTAAVDYYDPRPTPEAKPRTGVFDRIGDFIKSDRGRAALLRSGAETMQHGLGAGVAAGAQYYDDQKEREAKQNNWVSEMGLKTRQTDIDQQEANDRGAYYGAMAENSATDNALEASKLRQTIWKERMGYALDERELESLNNYRAEQIRLGYQGDATQRRGQDITARGQSLNYDASTYGTDSANFRHVTPQAGGAGIGTNFSAAFPAADGEPAVTMSGRFPAPTKGSIDFLKGNPDSKGEFERRYGPGSAAVYLGGR